MSFRNEKNRKGLILFLGVLLFGFSEKMFAEQSKAKDSSDADITSSVVQIGALFEGSAKRPSVAATIGASAKLLKDQDVSDEEKKNFADSLLQLQNRVNKAVESLPEELKGSVKESLKDKDSTKTDLMKDEPKEKDSVSTRFVPALPQSKPSSSDINSLSAVNSDKPAMQQSSPNPMPGMGSSPMSSSSGLQPQPSTSVVPPMLPPPSFSSAPNFGGSGSLNSSASLPSLPPASGQPSSPTPPPAVSTPSSTPPVLPEPPKSDLGLPGLPTNLFGSPPSAGNPTPPSGINSSSLPSLGSGGLPSGLPPRPKPAGIATQ